MKKSNKFSLIIFILLIIIGSLSSCNSIQKIINNKNDTKEIIKSTKIPELIWWQIGEKPDDNDRVIEELNKYSSEKIGAKINIKYIDFTEWKQKVAVIVLGGEYFDLMFTDYTYYSLPVNLEGFADITDIIENDAPTLKEFIPDIVWDGVKIKNRIYSVPTYKDSSQTQYWVWDKDLVEKLGIDYKNIISFNDLDIALRTIKQANPDKYPLSVDKQGVQGLLDEFDAIGGFKAIGVSHYDKEAKVVNVLEDREVLKKLDLLHLWYNDGLISPDALTVPALPKYKMVYAQQGFEGADSIWSRTDGYNVVSTKVWGPVYSTTSIQGSMNVVSAHSKYIKESVKYLELVNTDPFMRNMLAYGIEGEHYKKTNEGTIEYINDLYKPTLYSQATFFTLMTVSPNPANQWEIVRQQTETSATSPILGFSFDNTNVKTEFEKCREEYTRYESELLTGARKPEEVIKELNQILYNNGLQKVIDEAQLQIDEFLRK